MLTLGWALTSSLVMVASLSGALALTRNASLADMRARPHANPGELEYRASEVRTLAITTDVFAALALMTGGISLWLTLHPEAQKSTARGGRTP